MNRAEQMKQFWAEVKAGLRPAPNRTKQREKGLVRRKVNATLDGSFGPDRNKQIIITIHSDGRLDLRPERTQRTETVHILDVYRFAIHRRANALVLQKARERKVRRAERLARERQGRAEARLLRPIAQD